LLQAFYARGEHGLKLIGTLLALGLGGMYQRPKMKRRPSESLLRTRKDTSPVLASLWATVKKRNARGPIEKKAALGRARPSSSRIGPSTTGTYRRPGKAARHAVFAFITLPGLRPLIQTTMLGKIVVVLRHGPR
jgi:hypothetical protein